MRIFLQDSPSLSSKLRSSCLTSRSLIKWLTSSSFVARLFSYSKLYENNRATNELDVSHFISDREVKQELRSLLDKLGESCRKILILFYYENLSMKEIVDHLHYDNEQVVRNKKYKCLQQLTGLIKDNPLLAKQIKELIR